MLDTFSHMHFSWGHVITALVAIIIALAMSRFAVGRLHRRRILVIVVALAAALVLHFCGIGVHDLFENEAAERALHACAILLLAFGLTSLIGLGLFDLAFHRARLTVPTILRDILQAIAFFIILLVVLRKSGVNLLSLVTTSAVLTAVIGLALQNTIANMFAGLSLQLDHTVSVGDWIQMAHWVGRITHIKWRSTFIVTRDGNNVILPNSELLRQEVLNFSKPSSVHRSTIKVGFAYRHPPREVARILVGALRGMPEILAEPAPDCLPIEFGESAIVYALRYWTDNVQRDIIVEGEVRVRVWYAAQRAGLEVPYPVRTVHTVQPSPTDRAAEATRQHQERLEALAGVDLFASLDAKALDLLAAGVRSQAFASGELILHQGDVGDSLYVIHDGDVTVSLSVGDDDREVATLKAGNFFGEMSLLTGEPRQATCRARTDVTCWVIGHEALHRVLRQNPKIAEDISGILAGRQQELDGQRANATTKPAPRPPDQRLLARIRDFFGLG
jgi:small-conductance mechanosensitive channel/CRP-like cAMP-binding protein